MVLVLLAKLGVVNFGMLGILVWYTFSQKDYLYFPSMVHLMTSPIARLLLSISMIYCLLVFAALLQHLLIGGRLRAVELTHLREYGWLTFSEFLLSMTTFRDDFNSVFLLRFFGLMIVKAGHWLSRDRIELMEETPQLPHRYHQRMVCLLLLLYVTDIVGLTMCLKSLYSKGPSSLILFSTEFALMFLSLLITFARYLLNVNDARLGEAWEHRSTFLFYVELVGDLFKLSCCLIFFFVTIKYYGFPLHMFRDMVMTAISFTKRISDMIKYRKAMRELDHRYPNVPQEELERLADKTCIICREEMHSRVKKLVCGHYFHFKCLKSWLERQQACPTCRRDILQAQPQQAPSPQPPPQQQRPTPTQDEDARIGLDADTDSNIKELEVHVKQVRQLIERTGRSRERMIKLNELQESLRRTSELLTEMQAEEGRKIVEQATSSGVIKLGEGSDKDGDVVPEESQEIGEKNRDSASRSSLAGGSDTSEKED